LTNIFNRPRTCLFFLHLAWKACHSIAKSLIFPNMKTNCSYAEWFTYNSALKFDYLFFDTPCICDIFCQSQVSTTLTMHCLLSPCKNGVLFMYLGPMFWEYSPCVWRFIYIFVPHVFGHVLHVLEINLCTCTPCFWGVLQVLEINLCTCTPCFWGCSPCFGD
jgi:hypothetical protein